MMKELNNPLPVNWGEIRKQVINRDNNKCVICGKSENSLDVHHLHPKYFGGSHEINNLISLCKKCHTDQHIDLQIKLGRKIILEITRIFKKFISEYKDSPLYKKDFSPLLKLLTNNTSFRSWQEDIINAILSGNDVLVIKPTGSGKSLCFQLPALMAEKQSLIISPLKALMRDQVQNLQRRGIPATYVNSDLSFGEKDSRLKYLQNNYFKLFYLAPERFKNLSTKNYFDDNKEYFNIPIQYLIIDEAHCIDKFGLSFREDYGRLDKVKVGFKNPQTLAFTATANSKTREIIIDKLKLKNLKIFVQGVNRPNIIFSINKIDVFETRRFGRRGRYIKQYRRNPFDVKYEYLKKILYSIGNSKTLIFVRTIPEGQKILDKINKYNNNVIEYCNNNPTNTSYRKINANNEVEIDTMKIEFYNAKLDNIIKSNIQDRFMGI